MRIKMAEVNTQMTRLNCTISKTAIIALALGSKMLSNPAMKNITPTVIAAYPKKRGIISDLTKTIPIEVMSIGAGPKTKV
jgi:hypothetical protein